MTDTSGVSIPQAISSLAPTTDGQDNETWFGETLDTFKKSVSDITGISKLVGAAISGAQGAVSGAAGQVSAATGQEKQAVDQQSQAAAKQATIEGAAKDQLVNDNLTVATAEHTTPQQMVDRANRLSYLGQQIQADNDDLRARAGVSIWNDPLQFINNLFTNAPAKKKQQADVESFQTEAAILQAQQNQTSDAYKVNAGIDAAHGVELTKAIIDQESAIANQKKAAVDIEAAKFQSSNAQVMASLTEAQMSNAVKMASVAGSAMNEARNNVAFDLTAGSKSARSIKMEQQAKDLLEADKANQLSSIAMGRSIPVTPEELRTASSAQKAAFNDIRNNVAIGVGAGLTPAESPLGSTPVDAANNKVVWGIRMTNAAQEDMVNMIQSTASELANKQTRPGQPTFRTLSPEVKRAMVNDAVIKKYDSLYSSIPATGSFLSPGPLSSLLKQPMVAGTALGQAMAPMAIDPLAPINYDALGQQAEILIKSGAGIPEVAAQMAVFGKQMTAQVNSTRGLARVALPQLGTEQKPNFNVNITDSFGNIKTLDLNNKASIETYLTRRMGAVQHPQYNRAGLRRITDY